MENILFLDVPILKHIRVHLNEIHMNCIQSKVPVKQQGGAVTLRVEIEYSRTSMA